MSAEFASAAAAQDTQPCTPWAGEGGSLGTLCWQRVARVAGLAGAVAVLAATSFAATHMVRVVSPSERVREMSVVVVSPQRAPAP